MHVVISDVSTEYSVQAPYSVVLHTTVEHLSHLLPSAAIGASDTLVSAEYY